MVIVVLKAGVTAAQIGEVLRRIEGEGLRAHLSRGEERTIVGVIGDERALAKIWPLAEDGSILPVADSSINPTVRD